MSSKLKKLGTLADVYQSEKLDGTITRIRLDKIQPSEHQPRQNRTVGIEELASSIAQDGLLSPIVVTRHDKGYRIIAGERRYHALKSLNIQEAECRIISREERDYYRIAIIENLQRENLNPQEEAQALKHLKTQENYSDAELAQIIGKSRNYVTEILGIASLPDDVLEQCRTAGMDNKNLMIQAVQAHKKGSFRDFIKEFQEGRIKTIRDARSFLGKEQGRAAPDNSKSSLPAEAKPERPKNFEKLERKGAVISLTFSTAEDAAKAESRLAKFLNKNI